MRFFQATPLRVTLLVAAIYATGRPVYGDGPVFLDGNGNYYDLIHASGISWSNANSAAAAATFEGLPGHLVTITSAEEDAFINAHFNTSTGSQLAWTGGYEPADNGIWRWAVGPETGVQYSQRATATPPFNYANWGGSEPNDAGWREDYMSFNIGLAFAGIGPGQWADSPNVPPLDSDPIIGYLMEYDTQPSPPPPPPPPPGITWSEVNDAGQLLSTAQVTEGPGKLDQISGALTGYDDVDLYQIKIVDPAAFSVLVTADLSVDNDAQLFLFDFRGFWVMEDDDSGEGYLPQFDPGSLGGESPGLYYLAISLYDTYPMGDPLTGWDSYPDPQQTGPYQLFLTGAECAINTVPEPGTLLLLSTAAVGLALWSWRRRKGLSSVIGLVLIGAAPAQAGTLADGLIGYWQFDGNARDASGGGRDLELVGGVGFAPGLFGSALDLHNDATQYACRPVDDGVYDFGANDFSIQAWVKFNNTSHAQALVEKFEGMQGPGWTFCMLNDPDPASAFVWHLWSDPSAVLYSPRGQVIATRTWHHVLTRRNASTFDIFYDGTRVVSGSDPDPVPNTSYPLLIGKRNDADGRGFPVDGRVDEVAIWSRALTDGELAALYNGGVGVPIPEPATMLMLFAGALLGLPFFRRWQDRQILVPNPK